jgi:hypothetical protein
MNLAHAATMPTSKELKLKEAGIPIELLVEWSVAVLSRLAYEIRRWLQSAKREDIEQRQMACKT